MRRERAPVGEVRRIGPGGCSSRGLLLLSSLSLSLAVLLVVEEGVVLVEVRGKLEGRRVSVLG